MRLQGFGDIGSGLVMKGLLLNRRRVQGLGFRVLDAYSPAPGSKRVSGLGGSMCKRSKVGAEDFWTSFCYAV